MATKLTRSRLTFDETIEALKEAIAEAGNTLFASIDQSAAARSAGLSLRPTTLLVFGNPKGGTPFMEAFPPIALDLPLKLLVWEEESGVSVAYVPMSDIAARNGVVGMGDRIESIDRAVDAMVRSVA